MLQWAMQQTAHPVAIRVPGNGVISSSVPVETDYGTLDRYKVTQQGDTVAIIALGSFFALGENVARRLQMVAGITPTLINPRYITGLDNDLLDKLKTTHRAVITLEDGILDGGFGEKIARYYGNSDMRVLNYGLKKEFLDRYDVNEVLSTFLYYQFVAHQLPAILVPHKSTSYSAYAEIHQCRHSTLYNT